MRPLSYVVATSAAFLLASCGGGGDSSTPSIDVDRTDLQYVAFRDGGAYSQTVNVRLSGGSGTYYADARSSAPFSISVNVTSDTTASVSVAPVGPITAPSSGNVTFLLCRDAACNQVAWSRTFPYSISVYDLTPRSLTFNGNEGASPAAQVLTISPADPQRRFTVSAVVGTGVPNWLSVTRTSDTTFSVAADTTALPHGSYNGSVRLRQGSAGGIDVPIVLNVGDGAVTPLARTIIIGAVTTASSTVGSFPVEFNGGQAPSWTATTNRPWLVLSNASGTGRGTVNYQVDTSLIGNIENWSSDTATVTLQAAGQSPISFPIRLDKQLPEVHGIWPNPVKPGVASTVKVTGRGFTGLSASAFELQDTVGVTASIVSDRVAVLSLPALPAAGGLALRVPNALQATARSALLSAVAQPSFPVAQVPTTGAKRSLIFDPLHTALFSVNRGNNSITTFRFQNGSWQRSETPITEIGDIGLSPDKRTLYVTSGSQTLIALDPVTMQRIADYTLPADIRQGINLRASSSITFGHSFTNDMRLWIGDTDQWTRLTYFDLLTKTFHFHNGDGLNTSWTSLYHPTLVASPDGSHMLIKESGLSPTQPTRLYTPDAPALVTYPPELEVWQAAFSTDNSRYYSRNGIYETATYTQIASAPNTVYTGLTRMSPDGRWFYLTVLGQNYPNTPLRIDVYDANQGYTKVGEIALPGQVCAPAAFDCGEVLAIHPDGHTLFWIGSQQLVVIPIPSTFRSSTLGARLRATAR